MFEGQDNLCHVEAGGVLHEDALTLQVHEQLAPAQILQDQIQLPLRLSQKQHL